MSVVIRSSEHGVVQGGGKGKALTDGASDGDHL